jgi:hypothetical protein
LYDGPALSPGLPGPGHAACLWLNHWHYTQPNSGRHKQGSGLQGRGMTNANALGRSQQPCLRAARLRRSAHELRTQRSGVWLGRSHRAGGERERESLIPGAREDAFNVGKTRAGRRRQRALTSAELAGRAARTHAEEWRTHAGRRPAKAGWRSRLKAAGMFRKEKQRRSVSSSGSSNFLYGSDVIAALSLRTSARGGPGCRGR